MSDRKLYIECACSSSDHLISVEKTKWTWSEHTEHDLYIECQVSPYLGFFRRLWLSVKYILGLNVCRYGHWSCCIVPLKKARELVSLIQEHIQDAESDPRRKKEDEGV